MSATTPIGAVPQPVLTAARLYIAGSVIGLVGAVVGLIALPAAIEQATVEARRTLEGQDTGGVDIGAIAAGTAIAAVTVALVLSVAVTVLTVVFAVKMRHGRNWARIVLTVLAGLNVLGLLSLLLPGNATPGALVGAVGSVVTIIAAVLSFQPVANAWFRGTKAARTAY